MLSNTPSTPARRTLRRVERRARRRPAVLVTSLALAVVAVAGVTATAPASQAAQAEASGSLRNIALASFTTPLEPVATISVSGTDAISSGARQALAEADESMAAAETIVADIAASGLDVGEADTSVDTAELEEAVSRLEGAERLPAPLVPDLTEDVAALISDVEERVNGLRGKLDAAMALKAEQEAAAEKARLEAEAAAAAEAEARAQAEAQARTQQPSRGSSSPAPVYSGGGGSGDNSPAGAQATARAMLGNYGWGDDQFSCLVSLWHKESGWNYQALNRSSGAFGIPQALPGSKMASAGADWQTSAATQVAWGLGYISGRYGSPCGAWGHSQSVGWY